MHAWIPIILSFALLISACSLLKNPSRSSQPAPAAAVLVAEDSERTLLRPNQPSGLAQIDPGMVISPDTSIDAHIRVFMPPEDVDPAMIIPGNESKNRPPLDNK